MSKDIAQRSKRIAITLLIALSTITPSWAKPEGEGSAAATNAAELAKTTAANPSPAAPVVLELEQLRESVQAQVQKFTEHSQELESERAALHEQLGRIAALEAKLGVVPDAAASSMASVAVASPAAAPVGPAAQPPQDVSKQLTNLENKLKGLGPFTFAGDFRLRDEPYFGGPINQSQVRNRERYRARFYINAKLNDDISGGLGLATGDINDPITSNQTANQDFTRKPFYLDRAFITYTPHQFKPLTLIGGKFVYPWYRTELTWDNDINPEGVAQKLEWKSDDWHVLRQFALIGFELPFGESTKTSPVTTFTSNPPNALLPYPNSSIKQSVVYGGQIQTKWQLASWLSFTADTAFYNFHNADQIALANQVAYGPNASSSPGVGVLKLNNTLTNSYQIATESFTVPVSGGGTTVVNSEIIGAKFNSKFALSDTIAQFDIKTPSAAWPIRFLADYVQNTEACGNDPGIRPLSAAQLATLPANATVVNGGTTGAGLKNGVCDSHDRRAHWLEARFGRQQEKGDWQFAYTHMLIEREAVLSIFDFSDIRQGSNVQQNRVEASYQANKNVQLGFIGFFGRQLATTNATETELKRLQFDVIYKF